VTKCKHCTATDLTISVHPNKQNPKRVLHVARCPNGHSFPISKSQLEADHGKVEKEFFAPAEHAEVKKKGGNPAPRSAGKPAPGRTLFEKLWGG
jgi:hypothetical protein